MRRITHKTGEHDFVVDAGCASVECDCKCQNCAIRNIINRLEEFEDIFGEEYDFSVVRDAAECVHSGHPAARKPGTLIDFVKCGDDAELKNSIRYINEHGWRLIAATFDGVEHYLFFERSAYA